MAGAVDRSRTTSLAHHGRAFGRSVFAIRLDQLEIQDGSDEQLVPG